MTFYERCKDLANQKGISLNELGNKVKVSGAAINGWKTGYPRADVAQRVAEVLGVSVEYLIKGESTNGLDISTGEIQLLKYYRGCKHDYRTLLMAQAHLCYQFSDNPPSDEDVPLEYIHTKPKSI